MKAAIFGILLLLCVMPDAQAQSYSIDWFTIDGGGGASTGGVYSVSGTMGQPDAGSPMAGGTYSLSGGFRHVLAVQTPGTPLLRIFFTTTNTAVVAWAAPSAGFNLLQNIGLATTNWMNVTNTVSVVGGENRVIISPPSGNRFYRLFKP